LPSLEEAAKRSRAMRRTLKNCTFVCSDLGDDVLGQDKKLRSWSLSDEPLHERGHPEDFKKVRGGGIRSNEKFDIISIQFAVHCMFGAHHRAKRLFKTISELLDVGGSFIAITIDARVVINHLMSLGIDLRGCDSDNGKLTTAGSPADETNTELRIGDGACRFTFRQDTSKRIFHESEKGSPPELFGLEYLFQLVEGSDQAAGTGDAVKVPDYLLPLPVLKTLAKEVGFELDYFFPAPVRKPR
jgi:mRNA (guanine-N7-)-methyltransferase